MELVTDMRPERGGKKRSSILANGKVDGKISLLTTYTKIFVTGEMEQCGRTLF
jgi:hypothetical protein